MMAPSSATSAAKNILKGAACGFACGANKEDCCLAPTRPGSAAEQFGLTPHTFSARSGFPVIHHAAPRMLKCVLPRGGLKYRP
jgi:hypothetical protein